MSYKKEILKLRREGKTYNEIVDILGCAKSTISYHCNNEGLGSSPKEASKKVTDEYITRANQLYKNNILADTMKILKKEFPNKEISKRCIKHYLKPKEKNTLSVKEKKRRRVESVTKRRKKLKRKSIEYLGGKCSRCGYDKCQYALETHHINPEEKDFNLSIRGMTRSWEKIKKELDKCILVCANCHREIHHKLNNTVL